MKNRLSESTSPYLLQHAENPVDWFPWGYEAFEKARIEDKPIFLSLGYSTCHWCHVMEHESFEDASVAVVLNEHFVSIKVDREQMPDVDHYYMTVTQALTGRGGWPNTILMTPDKRPFYAGTYFPKAHLLNLLSQVVELWKEHRPELETEGDHIARTIGAHLERSAKGAFDTSLIEIGARSLLARFDSANGGFSLAPKFPSPANIQLLLRHFSDTGDEKALDAVRLTLSQMRCGGIYDQIGFGFHRYSTDAIWRIPHFEKMLYDQAGLVLSYIEAFQVTGDPIFRQTVEEILTYVDRDLSDSEGGFHSAEDADSEGVEGKFYLWTLEELREVLRDSDAEFALSAFRASREGNYREEATGQATNENVLERAEAIKDALRFERIRTALFEAREKRVRPFKDDKVLADWNGMMIAAFARAGAALVEPKWTQRAAMDAEFVFSKLVREDGGLWHQYRRGKAEGFAHLDDYAFLVVALIELYRSSFDPNYLAHAKTLADCMIEELWDSTVGGFFLSANNELPARAKVGEDSAHISGNAAAALGLAKLARITGDSRYEEMAKDTVNAFAQDIARFPEAYVGLLLAANFFSKSGSEVVIVGEREWLSTQEMVLRLESAFASRSVMLLKDSVSEKAIGEFAPWTWEMTPKDGKATAYVCRNFACELPVTSAEDAIQLMLR